MWVVEGSLLLRLVRGREEGSKGKEGREGQERAARARAPPLFSHRCAPPAPPPPPAILVHSGQYHRPFGCALMPTHA